jgi:hypothetical protein
MKRTLLIMALVGMVLLSATPMLADDTYVVMAGRGVGTKITSLPFTINAPGFYYVTGNLVAPNGQDGITINADNVTLDLMGFKLSNPVWSNTAIRFNGSRTDVEIRNGTLTRWGDCIYADSASTLNVRVINVRVQAASHGVYLPGDAHLIKGCQARNTIDSFDIGSGTISNCTVIGDQNSSTGIYLGNNNNLNGGMINDNFIYHCLTGINCYSATTVMNNMVSGLANTNGITARYHCTIIGNTTQIPYMEIPTGGLATQDNCTIVNNTVTGLTYGNNCVVVNNTTQ